MDRFTRLLAALEGAPGQTVGRLGNLRLGSHFQPIYSLSHMRVVGHEALLRTRDAQGHWIPPPAVFAACRDLRELAWCDSLSRTVHMKNFTANMPDAQWLFLNVHPKMFEGLARNDGGVYMRLVTDYFKVSGDRLVLEVLENDVTDTDALETALGIVRGLGCLIAIDDFGAGHSNFDRVWRLRPDIVKLDRSLIARAARDRRAQRVVSQMVSLLHECGTMVLMEGVETLDEALLAMESDADMVQGYFFGRPQAQMVPSGHSPAALTGLYAGLNQRHDRQRAEHQARIAPFRNAIGHAGMLLGAGHSLESACQGFMGLPNAEVCYLLDANGYQIGTNVWHPEHTLRPELACDPLRDSNGACWARRPYFRRAVNAVGRVQITRPYRSLNGSHICVTVSLAFYCQEAGQQTMRIVAGDLVWSENL